MGYHPTSSGIAREDWVTRPQFDARISVQHRPEAIMRRRAQALLWGRLHPDKRAQSACRCWLRRRLYQTQYHRIRRAKDIAFRIKNVLGSRMRKALKCNSKHTSSQILTGCSIESLIHHLESHFLPGMTWRNYGRTEGCWSIDHIRPCASFNLSHTWAQRQCFNFKNLRPMWHIDNIKKGCKVAA